MPRMRGHDSEAVPGAAPGKRGMLRAFGRWVKRAGPHPPGGAAGGDCDANTLRLLADAIEVRQRLLGEAEHERASREASEARVVELRQRLDELTRVAEAASPSL